MGDYRIGLVGPLPPPSGGMANQTQQLARRLADEGLEVRVVQTNAPYRPRLLRKVRGVRALARLLPYVLQLWRTAGQVDLFHIMANSGWSWHLFAAPAVYIGRLRGIPVVVSYHGGEAEAFFQRSFRRIRPALARVAAILVPSDYLAGVFRRHGFGVHIIRNIVDTELFSKSTDARSRLHQRVQAPQLLVSRNLEPVYDIATALRAFRRVHAAFPDAHMIVCGSGPELDSLESQAQALGISHAVNFTGRVENRQMAALYQSADVMLNPSLADNMPISILEALACGVPVVTTDVGGVPSLVAHGKTALLVSPGDAGAMATAVISLLNNAALADALATAGRAEARKFTWPNIRDALFDVYADVLAQQTKDSRIDKHVP